MTDTAISNPAKAINAAIAQLRASRQQGALVSGDPLVPGLWFSMDPESDITGDYVLADNALLWVRFKTTTTGRWLALHIMLGGIDFAECEIFGFVLRSVAFDPINFKACLRSGTATDFVDYTFPREVLSHASSSINIDLIDLSQAPDIPPHAAWRELIFFFKPQSFDLAIQDLKIFLT